jgi:hypothetical protein
MDMTDSRSLEEAVVAAPAPTGEGQNAIPPGRARPRRRGRPLEVLPDAVLDAIRRLARGRGGLFRIHRRRPGLYARARRLFGSWSGAVLAAGLDYADVVAIALERAASNRRRARRRSHRAAREFRQR